MRTLCVALVLACGCGSEASPTSDGGGGMASCLAGGLGRDHLMIGFTGDDVTLAAAPFDVRYQYLAGGVFDGNEACTSCASGCTAAGKSCANNAGCGWWGCWQYDQDPPGAYVRDFVKKTSAAGLVPMVTYYELLQASGVQEGTAEVTQAATNVALMTRYLADFRFLAQQIGTTPALLHVEPDFWGYAQQANADPHQLPAAVASANPTDCAGDENSIAGLGRCFLHIARKYAPNAKVSLHASGWSTKMDVLSNTNASLDVVAEAQKTAAFLRACGGDEMDYVAVDWSDRDAGFYQSMGRNTWWDATNAKLPTFTQALAWTGAIGDAAGKPVAVWQIPVGNAQGNDTCDHYKDNRIDYVFAHTADVVRANVALVAFGAGAGCQTNPSTDGMNLINKTKAASQPSCP